MTCYVVLGSALIGVFAACPPVLESEPGSTYTIQSDDAWAMMPRDPDADFNRPNESTSSLPAAVVGQWSGPLAWDVIAIHAAVLPNGHVIHYSYPWGTDGSRARVWDPISTKFSSVDWSEDIFCSGLSHQADGKLLITGGNDPECQFQGRYDVNLFDPLTSQWSPQEAMVDGRWYPTNVNLPDGSTLIFSGLDRTCDNNPMVEHFAPGVGVELVPNANREIALYPRMHLLSNGQIAHVGPESATFTFDLDNGWQFVDWNNQGWRGESTSVLLPGRTDQIMIIGGFIGSNVVTNTAEIIDFSGPNPQWQYTGSMHHARAHADAVILPDQTVLVMGGGRIGLYDDPVYIPEIYDPETETWTELAPHVWGRMYHATSVLLPDARVLVAGQDSGLGNLTAEIYQPPYLFQGPRPTIVSAPTAVQYGSLFPIVVDDASAIDSAVLVKLSAVTHSVNFDQRLVEVPFAVEGDEVLVGIAPDGPNLAPPGYYMLFVLNDGVPSVASMVRIQPNAPADLNGDGVVAVEDLLQALAAWGPCGGCPADLNGDGLVDIIDLLTILAAWG